jgi:hypothetical protein
MRSLPKFDERFYSKKSEQNDTDSFSTTNLGRFVEDVKMHVAKLKEEDKKVETGTKTQTTNILLPKIQKLDPYIPSTSSSSSSSSILSLQAKPNVLQTSPLSHSHSRNNNVKIDTIQSHSQVSTVKPLLSSSTAQVQSQSQSPIQLHNVFSPKCKSCRQLARFPVYQCTNCEELHGYCSNPECMNRLRDTCRNHIKQIESPIQFAKEIEALHMKRTLSKIHLSRAYK